MTKQHERILWIDIAKGIAILMVLYGHSMRDAMRVAHPLLDYTYRCTYIFHMNFFFWLSGYTAQMGRAVLRKPRTSAFLIKRIKTMLVPWALYSAFIFVVFSTAMRVAPIRAMLQGAGYANLSLPTYTLQALQAQNDCATHLWFIYVLFWITVLVYALDRCVPERHRTLSYAVVIALCLAGLPALRWIDVGNWHALFGLLFKFIPFYLLGMLMQGKDIRFANLWGVLGVVYILLRARYWSGFYGDEIAAKSRWANTAVQYAGYLFLPGTFLLLRKLAVIIAERGNARLTGVLQYLGRDSFLFYLFHQPFCCALAGLVLYGKLHLPAGLVMALCIALSLLVPIGVRAVASRCKAMRKA